MNEVGHREAERRRWASVGVDLSEQRLQPPLIGTTVRAQEAGSGQPVVMIHGASNSGVSWAQLVARLPDHRCIVVDRPVLPGAGHALWIDDPDLVATATRDFFAT